MSCCQSVTHVLILCREGERRPITITDARIFRYPPRFVNRQIEKNEKFSLLQIHFLTNT